MEETKKNPDQTPRFSTGQQIWLLILLFFTSQFVSTFLFVAIRPTFGKIDFEDIDYNNIITGYLLAFLGSISIFLVAFVLFLRITKESFKTAISTSKFQFKYFGFSLLLLILGIVASEGLYMLNHFLLEHSPSSGFLEMEAEQAEHYRHWFSPLRLDLFPLALVLFALLPAIAEELVFRGLLLRKLEQVSNGKTNFAIVVSSLLFAAVHVQPWNLLPMIAMGIILGYAYVKMNDIKYPIIIHFLFNATQLVSAFFFSDQIPQ